MSGITDLIVWREAASLAVEIEADANSLRGRGSLKLADQIIRAANSIHANVAEAYGRGVCPDGIRMLRIAHSSADELEGHLRVLGMTKRLPEKTISARVDHTRRVGYLVYRYQLSVERRLK